MCSDLKPGPRTRSTEGGNTLGSPMWSIWEWDQMMALTLVGGMPCSVNCSEMSLSTLTSPSMLPTSAFTVSKSPQHELDSKLEHTGWRHLSIHVFHHGQVEQHLLVLVATFNQEAII